MKQREGHKVIILEPAKSRIARDECPACGKPKYKWTRRTDWRCCSKECTEKFLESCRIIYGWADLRLKVFKRDNYTCVKCGKHPIDYHKKPVKNKEGGWDWIEINTGKPDASQLVADHIKPIAIGGEEWNPKNIQTLCIDCNKIKTKQDQADIAKQRRIEKNLSGGQRRLKC